MLAWKGEEEGGKPVAKLAAKFGKPVIWNETR